MGVIAIAHAACDSDVGLADDSDDSRTSRDSEISLADYWTCFQCNTSNNNPKFRYCDKCYTVIELTSIKLSSGFLPLSNTRM